MSITKAFLYTILVIVLWVSIQLTILVPVKYFGGSPQNFPHLIGLTKIVSTLGAFLIIFFFIWKPKLPLIKLLNSKNYNLRIFLYSIVVSIGLILINRPFLGFYQNRQFLSKR